MKKGFVLSTYIYILLVFFLLLIGGMLAVLNNTKLLSLKMRSSSKSSLTDSDFNLVLKGNKDVILEVNKEYVDPGVIASTLSGADLNDNVIITSDVKTTKVGNYTINYMLTYNGITKEVNRNVKVLSTLNYYGAKSYNTGEYYDTLYTIDWDEDFTLVVDFNVTDSNKNYLIIGNKYNDASDINIEVTDTNELKLSMANNTISRTSGVINSNENIKVTFKWQSSIDTYTLSAVGTSTNITFSGSYAMSGVTDKTLRIGTIDNSGLSAYSPITINSIEIK